MADRVPFVGPSYQLRRKKADVQRSINLMPTAIESGSGKSGVYLQSIPGVTLFSDAVPIPPDPPAPFFLLGAGGQAANASNFIDQSPFHRVPTKTGTWGAGGLSFQNNAQSFQHSSIQNTTANDYASFAVAIPVDIDLTIEFFINILTVSAVNAGYSDGRFSIIRATLAGVKGFEVSGDTNVFSASFDVVVPTSNVVYPVTNSTPNGNLTRCYICITRDAGAGGTKLFVNNVYRYFSPDALTFDTLIFGNSTASSFKATAQVDNFRITKRNIYPTPGLNIGDNNGFPIPSAPFQTY